MFLESDRIVRVPMPLDIPASTFTIALLPLLSFLRVLGIVSFESAVPFTMFLSFIFYFYRCRQLPFLVVFYDVKPTFLLIWQTVFLSRSVDKDKSVT
jgi:hypothetical protein